MKNFAVIGNPIKHSLSPYLHNYVYNSLNINANYIMKLVDNDALIDIIKLTREGSLNGFNVTIPHKQMIIPLLDDINPRAKSIGSVNLVHNIKNKLYGNNTDWFGFYQLLLKNAVNVKDKEVIIIVAGGTSKSVIFALKHLGVKKIYLINRTFEKAQKMQDEIIIPCSIDSIDKIIKNDSIIINTTSLGMKNNESPIASMLITKNQVLIDIIYNPILTTFLNNGNSVGANTINGLDMFIYQALASIDLWFGKPLSKQVNFTQLKTYLERKLC